MAIACETKSMVCSVSQLYTMSVAVCRGTQLRRIYLDFILYTIRLLVIRGIGVQLLHIVSAV